MNSRSRIRKLLARITPSPVKHAYRVWARRWTDPVYPDPTLRPPPGYTKARADAIYGEAFRKCFEYLQGTGIQGDILEFGTLRGYTGRIIASLMKESLYPGRLYLYDSFEGLPEISSPVDRHSYEVAVNKVWFEGQMSVEPAMDCLIEAALYKIIPPPQLEVVKGFFENTLESHLPATKAALIHVDCDLYSSAKCVLDTLLDKDILQDGCILLLDDFNCNRANPLMGERRALAEAFEGQDRFQYSPWFSYGWHGQAFLLHDMEAVHLITTEGRGA